MLSTAVKALAFLAAAAVPGEGLGAGVAHDLRHRTDAAGASLAAAGALADSLAGKEQTMHEKNKYQCRIPEYKCCQKDIPGGVQLACVKTKKCGDFKDGGYHKAPSAMCKQDSKVSGPDYYEEKDGEWTVVKTSYEDEEA
uniref:CPW-WPC domain-containing protein n=1 Tax=Zooxanthella nutricula TaxID=1333877 RepID=A0A7S2LN93_9DINO